MAKKHKSTSEVQLEETTQTHEEKSGEPSFPESTANLESIADNLITSMPDVQEHAIQQEQKIEDEKVQSWSDLRDVDGNTFDPKIHKTDKQGNPTTSTKGKLIKKPGRKAGKNRANQDGSMVSNVPILDSEQVKRNQARLTGVAMANSIFTLGLIIGGDEWRPIKNEEHGIDEKTGMEDAFANYCEAKDINDFPPGVALTIAIVGYVAPRFTMPKTQQRVKSTGNWFKRWWANRKLKKHNLKAVEISSKENPETDPKAA